MSVDDISMFMSLQWSLFALLISSAAILASIAKAALSGRNASEVTSSSVRQVLIVLFIYPLK